MSDDDGASLARNVREFQTESIVVRIRWLGILMGYVLVQARLDSLRDPWAVRAFLALGAVYALLDTLYHHKGQGFLRRWPLFVSTMEAVFIALLCYYDSGLDSPFRWYYLLSIICCSIRYRAPAAWTTFALHAASLTALTIAIGSRLDGLLLMLAMLGWVTWAVSSLAGMLRKTGERLEQANAALESHRKELEQRVAERTEALRVSQARMIHQEKMAAFGLLAAGIAHEVGNPLAALSSLIQMLQRRNPDAYTAEKLELAGGQLARIQRIIREIVDFSRPGSTVVGPVRFHEVVDEALGIAKYYQRTKDRVISTIVADDLPPVRAVRDHLTQVVLNLLLNAIDATEKRGRIVLDAAAEGEFVRLSVFDDGRGIAGDDRPRIFQPFYTTKPKGTGLGLYISRQIVTELGGTLTFDSRPDEGTSFAIRLPVVPGRAGADPNEDRHERGDRPSQQPTEPVAVG